MTAIPLEIGFFRDSSRSCVRLLWAEHDVLKMYKLPTGLCIANAKKDNFETKFCRLLLTVHKGGLFFLQCVNL